MIYPPSFPCDYENHAEKVVYMALAGLPEGEYDVFFQKTFSGTGKTESDDYEIDFLVADLRGGRLNALLVIEVKGGSVSFLGTQNAWFQNGQRMETGPDAQARKNKYNLRKRFNSILQQVPIQWIAWFPDGIVASGAETPTNVSRSQIFDFNSLGEVRESIAMVFDRYREKHSDMLGDTLAHYSGGLKISLLRGLGIVQPLNVLLKTYEEKFLELELEQKTFFESLYQIPRLAVTGGAGSGKTLLATSSAIDFGNEGKKVLFLCFNRMLYLALEATFVSPNIQVSTFHTFAYNCLQKYEPAWLEKNPVRDEKFYMQLLPERFKKVISQNPMGKKYDALIVDEAQDFEKAWLEMAFKFTNQKSRIILFFDENQNIFDRHFQIPGNETFVPFKLTYNFRNTRKICEFVEKSTGISIIPRLTPEGLDVETFEYAGLEDLVDKINRVLLKLVTIEKISLLEMVLLIDGHVPEHQLNTLDHIGQFKLKAWDVNEERTPGALNFTSISRFKGLESNIVLVVSEQTEDLTGNKLFYTQCTRAKSLLKIFWEV